MRSIVRSGAAVVVGFVAASLVMMLVETVSGQLLYPELAEAAQGIKDRETLREMLAAAPGDAFLVIIAGWVLGSVVGGWVAARLAARHAVRHGLALGALLTLAGVANHLLLPPPLWFRITSLVVMMPAAYLGARLASRRDSDPHPSNEVPISTY